MLSRVAENIYWMARYLERAENTARLVSVHSETRLDHLSSGGFYWEPVLRVTGALEDYETRGLGPNERDATNFLVSDPLNPTSVLSCIARARENIRILRETLPRESWEAVQALHQVALRPGAASPQRRDEHLREIIMRTQGIAGLFLGAMNDDEGYAVLRLGRAVERGDFAARVLLAALGTIGGGDDLRAAEWIAVLRSLTGYQMYRRSVRGPVTPSMVVRFLACSTVFPRALTYCVREAERALKRLPDSGPVVVVATRLSSVLAADDGMFSDEHRSAGALTAAQAGLSALHDAITANYFAPPPQPSSTVTQAQVLGA